MSEITLNIDGKVCKGTVGDTILDIARKNDVYIPTLCYLEGISAIGSCRMCVVEVEGSNKLLTSCTTPATDGMKIHTQQKNCEPTDCRYLNCSLLGATISVCFVPKAEIASCSVLPSSMAWIK